MADFIDYAKADVTTVWELSVAADGHPAPYRLRYIELGNEERVDEVYAQKFQALARATWAKDPGVVPGGG
jgi:alpha-L-arabinofuranosidase